MRPIEISKTTIYSGRVFDLSKARINEDGVIYEREIIEHAGSAVVLPVHSNGDITLVRQYRHAAAGSLLEIPAGTVEPGETPLECAAREIEEETGLRAAKIEKISEFYVSPGFLTEKMHLFAATDLVETRQNMDMSLAEAASMVADGLIVDAKTIIGILLASGAPDPF
ncbi:MAG: NUDIX hydrolase [Acidobacteriota bacterium]|nr:NUDIX hydrolase [Acidobacteriota bacterium]